jgi:hypothetical protein
VFTQVGVTRVRKLLKIIQNSMTINLKNVAIATVVVTTLVGTFFFVIPQLTDLEFGFGANTAEACCGDGDGGGMDPCERGLCNPPQPPVPASCDFLNANPTTLPHGGGNVNLSWGTTNATSVSINQGVGTVAADGSRSVFVGSTKTFTLTAVGTGGNDTCAVTVTVRPATPVASCDFFTANRTSLPNGGGNVTLSWGTTNATSASINQGVGSVPVDGSRTVFVNATKTFTLTAVGTGGNDTCAVTVTVDSSQPVAECLYLNASKTVVDEDGENVTLSWDTNNATSVSISGIGSVAESGSRTVFVNTNRTFTLTAVGTGGNDTCAVTIHVDEQEEETPRCDYLNASDTRVEEGDRITLSWGTTNADRVTISPDLGDVAQDGSATVTVDEDTTYTLRARNLDNGQEDSCSVTVRVEEDEDEDDDRKTPRCDLEISDDRVKRGERVTLSWETTHVDDIRIRDDRGNTIFDTDNYSRSERKRYFDGSIDLIINQSTEFTMTAGGVDGGSRTCRVDVDVEDIAIYEKRDQTPVISLTQVPYTGFEAGKFLTFLFYAILTLWALFVAYVMVIKKSSVFGFSLYQKGPHISESDMEDRKKVEALVAKYAGTSWK